MRPARISPSSRLLVIGAGVLVACAKESPPADTAAADSTTNAAAGQKVAELAGFDTPESVKYDAERDVFYVSNINGNPSSRDNNGYIATIALDSPMVATRLVEGGRNGVTLHAPKGMALAGDTLYVADIDAVRLFNRRTGALIASVTIAGATFLNDVVVGPDGVYITDTAIQFDAQGNMTHPGTDRIYRLVGRRATEAAKGDSLGRPNGIAWDAAGNRFVIAPFGASALLAWAPGSTQPTTMVTGPGQYDGVEILANGNILVSSWADSTVHVVHGGTHMMPAIRNVSAPADIGVDTKRNHVVIPRFMDNKVEFYRIP